MYAILRIAKPAVADGYIGAKAMPQFDPVLIEVMKKVLEDTMTRVPLEYSTPAAKAYFADRIAMTTQSLSGNIMRDCIAFSA